MSLREDWMPLEGVCNLMNELLGSLRGNGHWTKIRSATDPDGCTVLIQDTKTGTKYLVRAEQVPERRIPKEEA